MRYSLSLSHFVFIQAVILISALTGCRQHDSEITRLLDSADVLMMERPDSSLTIINSIDSLSLSRSSEATRARYALLKSMAMDKNYIDTTTFDILQPAIDYYLINGNGSPDETFRTKYYQGVIFRNLEDDASYMKTLLEALEMENSVNDSVTLAICYENLANLYYYQNKFKEYILLNLEAAKINKALNDPKYELFNYAKALGGALYLADKNLCDSLVTLGDSVLSIYPSHTYYRDLKLRYLSEYGSKQQINDFIKIYDLTNISDISRLAIATAYNKLDEPRKAIDYLSEIDYPNLQVDTIIYQEIAAVTYENLGDFKNALYYQQKYTNSLGKQQVHLLASELLNAEKEYKLQLINQKEINRRTIIIWTSLSGTLLLVSLLIFIIYRARNIRLERNLAIANIHLLEDEYEKLTQENQSRTTELQTLLSKVAQTEVDTESLRQKQHLIRSLFRDKWKSLNHLCASFENEEDISMVAMKIIRDINNEFENLRSKKSIAELENSLNKYLDNIMIKIREECSSFLREDDFRLTMLIISAFSTLSITKILNITEKTYYYRRSRIIKKISESNPRHKDTFLQFLR